MGGDERVHVDIGGMVYVSTHATLEKSPVLRDVLATPPEDGSAPFVDRDGMLFYFVLNFMRTGSVCLDDRHTLQHLLIEAGFYGLKQMEAQISRQLTVGRRSEVHELVVELRGVKAVLKSMLEALVESGTMRRTPSLSAIGPSE